MITVKIGSEKKTTTTHRKGKKMEEKKPAGHSVTCPKCKHKFTVKSGGIPREKSDILPLVVFGIIVMVIMAGLIMLSLKGEGTSFTPWGLAFFSLKPI